MNRMNIKHRAVTFLAILCLTQFSTGCAGSAAYDRASQFHAAQKYDQALAQIDYALQQSPNNEEYISLKRRIVSEKAKFQCDTLLKKLNTLPTHDILQRISLLVRILAIPPTNPIVERDSRQQLRALEIELKGITASFSIIDNLLSVNECSEAMPELIKLSAYRKYIPSVAAYYENLNKRKSQFFDCINTQITNSQCKQNLALVGDLINIFPAEDDIKRLIEQVKSRCSTYYSNVMERYLEMNLPIFSYQACSTAEKLSINEDISSPTKAEIIQKAREKYTIPLVLRFSPNFAAADKQQIIHRVGQKLSNLTDNQLFSVYLATDENRRDPVVLDLAHEHMDFGWTQSRPNHMWSKYVAGSIKEPNAQYERLKFAYLDAVNHKQYLHNQYNQMIAQGMLLPAALLIGQMRTTASLIENIQSQLNTTPVYIDTNVYQKYQYIERVHEINLNINCSYKLVDVKHRKVWKVDGMDFKKEKSLTEITDVHPNDVSGVKERRLDKGDVEQALADLKSDYYDSLVARFFGDLLRTFEYRADDYTRGGCVLEASENHFIDCVLHGRNMSDELKMKFDCEQYQGSNQRESLSFMEKRPPVVLMTHAKAIKDDRLAAVPKRKEGAPLSTEDVVKRALPGVVSIKTIRGSGSGFIVSADGYVVTNSHVIGDCKDVLVKLADGRKSSAAVVEVHENVDLVSSCTV